MSCTATNENGVQCAKGEEHPLEGMHWGKDAEGSDVVWLQHTLLSPMIELTIKIDNVYPDDTIRETKTIRVPRPSTIDEDDEEYDDWAYDHIFCETGTGRPEGDSAYFVKITASPQLPTLVGREFEWGT